MNNVVILGIVSLLTDISSEMIYPLVPAFLTLTLGASPLFLGFMEGIAESLGNILKLFFGMYSDKIKKRKGVALSGYAVSALGKLLLIQARSFGLVFTSRVIDRIGKGIRTSPRDALIAESSDQDKRGAAFGLHRMLDSLGAVIGVGIAIWVLYRYAGNIRMVFYLSAIPALLSIIVLYWGVREKKKIKDDNASGSKGVPVKIFQSIKAMPRNLKIFYAIIFLFALGNSSNMFLLLKSLNIGFRSIDTLFLYLVYNISYCLFMYPFSKLSDRLGRKWFLIMGYALYGLVYFGFGFFQFKAMYWALFAIYGIYIGITEGVEKAFIVDHAPGNIKATALGLYSFIIGITLLPASGLAGWLWQNFGSAVPFYFSAVTGLCAASLLFLSIRSRSILPDHRSV